VGDVSKPFRTSFGYHIVKLLDKKGIQSFDEVKGDLKMKIQRDSRAQISRDVVINRVKKESNFKEDLIAYDELLSIIDTSYLSGSWNRDKAKPNSDIGNKTKISMNKEGGVYVVPCKVNGLPLKFIFDTGASDVIQSEETGFSIDGSTEELISALAKLKIDTNLRKNFGINARKRALSLWNQDTVAAQYLDLYQSIKKL
jgi:hypothetical protein